MRWRPTRTACASRSPSTAPTGRCDRSRGCARWPRTRPWRWCGSRRSSTSTRSTTSSTTRSTPPAPSSACRCRSTSASPGPGALGLPAPRAARGRAHRLQGAHRHRRPHGPPLRGAADAVHAQVAGPLPVQLGLPGQVHGPRAGLLHGLLAGHGPGPLRLGPSLPADGAGGGRRPGSAPLRRGGRGLPRRDGRPPACTSADPVAQAARTRATARVRCPPWTSGASACGGAARGATPTIRTAASPPSSSPSATAPCGRPGASTPGCRRTSSACSPRPTASRWPAASSASGPARPRTSGRRWPTSRTRFPGRFLLGIGASHGVVVADYTRPYSKMVGLPRRPRRARHAGARPQRRVLAALGPRMLELAAARAAGAHPYFVPVEHTARARDILGPGPLLAPEVAVVLETDPARARELARALRQHLPRPAQLHGEPAHASASATTTSTAAGATG